jgi:hypothetical protein
MIDKYIYRYSSVYIVGWKMWGSDVKVWRMRYRCIKTIWIEHCVYGQVCSNVMMIDDMISQQHCWLIRILWWICYQCKNNASEEILSIYDIWLAFLFYIYFIGKCCNQFMTCVPLTDQIMTKIDNDTAQKYRRNISVIEKLKNR